MSSKSTNQPPFADHGDSVRVSCQHDIDGRVEFEGVVEEITEDSETGVTEYHISREEKPDMVFYHGRGQTGEWAALIKLREVGESQRKDWVGDEAYIEVVGS
jgi:hypothetical protein